MRGIDGRGRADSVPPTSVPPGTEVVAGRYVLERELGAGGMGVVYLARDRQTGESVALKKLARVDAKSVLRFKREFRSLSDINHPNLVRLYDLGCASDGVWFFTQEYLPGTDFVSHLRRGCEDAEPPNFEVAAGQIASAFRQLACGVAALHGLGMLHRDLKPRNVLVCDERVVVLDFGLVRDIAQQDLRVTEEGVLSGTPAYMAPEQALSQPLSEAADWYAYGVMLYEVLTGALPFYGSLLETLRQKVSQEAEPILDVAPDAPALLADLCMGLLRRNPAERPTGREVLARLEGSRPPAGRAQERETTAMTEMQSAVTHVVGREQPLAQLEQALEDVDRGQSVAVHIHGVSGAGKSALIEYFLDRVEEPGAAMAATSDVLVLRSRCYEREAMPFKALDSIIDALVLNLAKRDDATVGHVLPGDIQTLAQLFPALGRIDAVKRLLSQPRRPAQARSSRQRAEEALRELFGRLAQAQRLIVWVDDLHWGDLDSVTILRSWLQQRSGAPFLLLLSYRSDEIATSPALRALLSPGAADELRVNERHVEVGALAPEAMRALCRERLGVHADTFASAVERIVEDARGNPFVASQLASLALARIERGHTDLQAVSFADMVTQTRELLAPEALSLIRVLAVAGRPVLPKLALRVAGVQHGGRALLHTLRSLHLVRTRDSETERLIELYHDRIREHVYAQLSPEQLREVSQALLGVLEQTGGAEPDWLFSLALAVHDHERALQYGVTAAERARRTLAFERAAELYAQCVELCEHDVSQRSSLLRKLGLVLGYSGRGVRAAEALLQAAQLSEKPAEVFELKRMAATHFLHSGRFEQGDTLLDELIEAAGIHAPASEGKLIAALLWERCRMGVRGLSFQRRAAHEVPAGLLERIDLLEHLRGATVSHDSLRSTLFVRQGLRLALEAGEPTRVARALSGAATLDAASGNARGFAAAHDLLRRADTLASELNTPRERMAVNLAVAAISFYEGELLNVLAPAAEVERRLRESSSESEESAYYYKFSMMSLRLGALSQLDWPQFLKEFSRARQEAQSTENVNALLMLTFNEAIYDEILGQPEASVARLDGRRAQLPNNRFNLLHVLHMTAVMHTAYVCGDYARGLEASREYWPAYGRSPLRRVATLGLMVHATRAHLLMSHYVRSNKDPQVLQQAAKEVQTAAEHSKWDWYARARLAYLQGDRDKARALYEQTIKLMDVGQRGPDALRGRYVVGRLFGGATGERQAEEALQQLEQECGMHGARSNLRQRFPELDQGTP